MVLPKTPAARSPPAKGRKPAFQLHRCVRAGEAEGEASRARSRCRQAGPVAPRHLRSVGPASDSRPSRALPAGRLTRCLRKAHRGTARIAPLRGTLGAALAECRRVRRQQIRHRGLPSQRLALSGLRDQVLQRRQALRPLRPGADRRRRALSEQPRTGRLLRPLSREAGAPGSLDRNHHFRPWAGRPRGATGCRSRALPLADRSRRQDGVHIPRVDPEVRPLPRPPVRPFLPGRLLRAASDLCRQPALNHSGRGLDHPGPPRRSLPYGDCSGGSQRRLPAVCKAGQGSSRRNQETGLSLGSGSRLRDSRGSAIRPRGGIGGSLGPMAPRAEY